MGAIPTTRSLLASQIAAATAAATSAANSDADAKVQAKLAKQYADGCARIYAELMSITLPVPWVTRGVWTAGTISHCTFSRQSSRGGAIHLSFDYS